MRKSFLPNSGFCPIHIRSSVCRLYGGNHTELSEQPEITFINDLGMLNAPASVVFAAQHIAINLKNGPVRRVTNGVGTHLQITFAEFFCQVFKMFLIAE